jgi:hypothetical protein
MMETSTSIYRQHKRSREQVIRDKMLSSPPAESTCHGKVSYTRQGATQAVAAMLKRGRQDRAYQCPHCGSWHIDGGIKPHARRRLKGKR